MCADYALVPFPHVLAFVTVSLLVRLMAFVVFTGLHSVILFAVNTRCFLKGRPLCKFAIVVITAGSCKVCLTRSVPAVLVALVFTTKYSWIQYSSGLKE